jgi:hypothetical protein
MEDEPDERELSIDQLSKLLSVVQVMACKLANESHGRSYDKARELNELLHLARVQISVIEAEAASSDSTFVPLERRRAPRSNLFAPLRASDE